MTVSDRLLGLLGGAMIIAAIALLFLGGERDTGGEAAAPEIEMVEPEDGSVLAGPLEVVFRLPADLVLQPGGWGVGDRHLHLSLDGIELMPATSDLQRLSEGEYRWRVGELDPGPHALQLLWSGPDHRPLAGTESSLVRVRVE